MMQQHLKYTKIQVNNEYEPPFRGAGGQKLRRRKGGLAIAPLF